MFSHMSGPNSRTTRLKFHLLHLIPFEMKPKESFPIVFHVFEVTPVSKPGVSLSNADLILQ